MNNMKRYFLIVLCAIVSVCGYAQKLDDRKKTDPKYLAGAVPEVDERVVFSKTIEPKSSLSDSDLYALMVKWAEANYVDNEEEGTKNRVLLIEEENKNIICYGEKIFTFRKNAIVWDRTKMIYQLTMTVNNGKCDVSVRNIKYEYSQDRGGVAEEFITDKIALNKKKDKLNRYFDKFRVSTIDYLDEVYASMDVYVSGRIETAPAAATGAVTTNKTVSLSATDLTGYKRITADKIPEKLLNSWTVISAGGSQPRLITALWGGVGSFGDKGVAFSILNTNNHSVDFLDNGDTYTISFYTDIYSDEVKKAGTNTGKSGLTPIKTPSGSIAFSEAWMIIECKKGTLQPSTAASVADDNSIEGLSKEGYNRNYLGEILNVWVK